MFAYDWPLNVRELEQALSTAVVLADGAAIDVEHLPSPVRQASQASPRQSSSALATSPQPARPADRLGDHAGADAQTHERAAIIEALARRRGNIRQAASDLGISRQALYRRIEKYDIEVRRSHGVGTQT